MSKIDQGSYTPTSGTKGSQASPKATGVIGTHHVSGVRPRNLQQRIGSYFGIRKLRRLMSPLNVADSDLSPISRRSEEEVIGDLSRLLISLNREDDAADEEAQLLRVVIQENVRRMMLVQKYRAAGPNGRAF